MRCAEVHLHFAGCEVLWNSIHKKYGVRSDPETSRVDKRAFGRLC